MGSYILFKQNLKNILQMQDTTTNSEIFERSFLIFLTKSEYLLKRSLKKIWFLKFHEDGNGIHYDLIILNYD